MSDKPTPTNDQVIDVLIEMGKATGRQLSDKLSETYDTRQAQRVVHRLIDRGSIQVGDFFVLTASRSAALDRMVSEDQKLGLYDGDTLPEGVDQMRLYRAAMNIYCGANWQADTLSQYEQAGLWKDLRDALGLAPGTATSIGVDGAA